MADYIERLRYEADITDLKAKLATVEASSKSTASEVSGHGSVMSRGWDGFKSTVGSVATGLLKLGAVGGTAFAAVGGYGIKAAADFQQTRIAFEGLLGDAQTADSFLRNMRDFAAKTPFELPGVLDAARQLMATGTSAENVIPVLTKIGNTAAALGVGEESISGVVRALGQMQGKGKASAEELNQIGEAIPGFSAVKAIAEGMGITVAEAFKLMEKGALPADVAIGHILTGMEKFPGAAGAMDRQSETLNGVISTLKDTFRNALIDGIEPFLPGLAKFGESLAPLMGRIVTFAVGGLKTAIGVIAEVVRGFRAMVEAFKAGDGDVTSSGIPGFFERIGNVARTVFNEVGESVSLFVNALRSGMTEDEVATPVERLAFIIRDIGDLVARVWPTIQTIITTAVNVIVAALPTLRDILLTVGEALVASVGWLLDHHELLIGIAAVIAIPLVSAFVSWAVAAGAAAVATVIAIAPVIAIGAAIALLVAGIIWAYENWGWFRTAVDAVAHFLADVLWPIIQTVAQWIGEHLPGAISAAIGFFKAFGQAVADIAVGAYNATRDVINWFGDVINFIGGLPGRLVEVAGDLFGFIRDAFRSAINWVINAWNGLRFTMPEIDTHLPGVGKVGGFSVGVPRINPLERGGLITRPTLALLGETARARPEIASPVPMMRQVFREELERTGGGRGGALVHVENLNGRDVAMLDDLDRTLERALFTARVGASSI